MPRIECYKAVRCPAGVSPLNEEPWPPEPGLMLVGYDLGIEGPTHVLYACPCGCGDATLLHIGVKGPGDPPTWQLTIDAENRPTLTPSVHHLGSCRAHYFIKSGLVQWC